MHRMTAMRIPFRRWLSTSALPKRLSSFTAPGSPSSTTPFARQKLSWSQPPRTCLVLKKPNSSQTTDALLKTLAFMKQAGIQVVVERQVADELSIHSEVFTVDGDGVFVAKSHIDAGHTERRIREGTDKIAEYGRTVDFGVTLGGDGTMLHYSSLFERDVPPVISFSLGTLGFLLPFDFNRHEAVLDQLIQGRLSVLNRMRLSVSLVTKEDGIQKEKQEFQAMNEVLIHRGREAHLATIDCYSGDTFLTDAKADGLIISTPTGSTAYSLSAGGPIVHPCVDAFLLTPICPQSLSFRTVLLPPELHLRLQMSKDSRGTGDVSIDGRTIGTLSKGDFVTIQKSPFPIPCCSQLEGGADWTKNISAILKWNQNFSSALQGRNS